MAELLPESSVKRLESHKKKKKTSVLTMSTESRYIQNSSIQAPTLEFKGRYTTIKVYFLPVISTLICNDSEVSRLLGFFFFSFGLS